MLGNLNIFAQWVKFCHIQLHEADKVVAYLGRLKSKADWFDLEKEM